MKFKLNENICKCLLLIILSVVLGIVIYKHTSRSKITHPKILEHFPGDTQKHTPILTKGKYSSVFIIPNLTPPKDWPADHALTSSSMIKFYINTETSTLYGCLAGDKGGGVDVNIAILKDGDSIMPFNNAAGEGAQIYPTNNNYIKIVNAGKKLYNLDFTTLAASFPLAADMANMISYLNTPEHMTQFVTERTSMTLPTNQTALGKEGTEIIYTLAPAGSGKEYYTLTEGESNIANITYPIVGHSVDAQNISLFHCVGGNGPEITFIGVMEDGYFFDISWDAQTLNQNIYMRLHPPGEDLEKLTQRSIFSTINKTGVPLDLCVVPHPRVPDEASVVVVNQIKDIDTLAILR